MGEPNMARLPAMKGAQVLFDISSESDITSEWKIPVYEAQQIARAHENGVFLVQSNGGEAWNSNRGELNVQAGSHGNSLIIGPKGDVVAKAPMFGEWLGVADLDLARLRQGPVPYSPHGFMNDFYQQGLASLRPMPLRNHSDRND